MELISLFITELAWPLFDFSSFFFVWVSNHCLNASLDWLLALLSKPVIVYLPFIAVYCYLLPSYWRWVGRKATNIFLKHGVGSGHF